MKFRLTNKQPLVGVSLGILLCCCAPLLLYTIVNNKSSTIPTLYLSPTSTDTLVILAIHTSPSDTETPTDTLSPIITFTPSTTRTSLPTISMGVYGNPWGYNFDCCNLIYDPPSNFCSYFPCISSFWDGVGYVVQCEDNMFSKSGGRSGVCSHHGGFFQNLYSP